MKLIIPFKKSVEQSTDEKSSGDKSSGPAPVRLSDEGQRLHSEYVRLSSQRKAAGKTHGTDSEHYALAKEAHGAAARRLAEHVQGKGADEELHLPQNHASYFTHTSETKHIPLHAIEAIRARTGGIARAEPNMALARVGLGGKREPISLEHHGNGKYKIMDGNSTFAIAQKHGWDSLPAHIWEKGQWSDSKEMKKSLQSFQKANVQNPHGDLPADHISMKTQASGGDHIFHRHELELPEAKRVKQHTNDYETLNQHAGIHKEAMDKMLHGLSQKVNFAHVTNGPTKKNFKKGGEAGGMTLTAPIKSKEKVDQRAHGKKIHPDGTPGYSNLKDLSRASIAVRHRADLPHVMEHLRGHMEKHGFELASAPKNRFDSPSEHGYSDIQLSLRHKATGHIGELQLHSMPMLHAKEHGIGGHQKGHDYYDDSDKIQDKIKAGTATNADHALKSDLDAKSRHLYGHHALARESKQTPVLEKHPAALFHHGHKIAATFEATKGNGHFMDHDGKTVSTEFQGKLPGGMGTPLKKGLECTSGDLNMESEEFEKSIGAGVKYYDSYDYGLIRRHPNSEKPEDYFNEDANKWEPIHPNWRVNYMHDATPIKTQEELKRKMGKLKRDADSSRR